MDPCNSLRCRKQFRFTEGTKVCLLQFSGVKVSERNLGEQMVPGGVPTCYAWSVPSPSFSWKAPFASKEVVYIDHIILSRLFHLSLPVELFPYIFVPEML